MIVEISNKVFKHFGTALQANCLQSRFGPWATDWIALMYKSSIRIPTGLDICLISLCLLDCIRGYICYSVICHSYCLTMYQWLLLLKNSSFIKVWLYQGVNGDRLKVLLVIYISIVKQGQVWLVIYIRVSFLCGSSWFVVVFFCVEPYNRRSSMRTFLNEVIRLCCPYRLIEHCHLLSWDQKDSYVEVIITEPPAH